MVGDWDMNAPRSARARAPRGDCRGKLRGARIISASALGTRRRLRLLGAQPRAQRRRVPAAAAGRAMRPRPRATAPRSSPPPRGPRALSELDAVLGRPRRSRPSSSPPRRRPTTRWPSALLKPVNTCSSRSPSPQPPRRPRARRARRASGRVLMPGHTFVYSPAVNAVRELIREGVVGDVHFITSSRMNLGKYQLRRRPLRPRSARPLHPPLLARAARRRGRRLRLLRAAPGRARDRLSHAHLRPRTDRQRADLLARAAQAPPDDRRRQPAHGLSTTTPPPTNRCASTTAAWTCCRPTPANFGEHQLIYRTGDVVDPARRAPGAAAPGAGGLRPRDPHRLASHAQVSRSGPADRRRRRGSPRPPCSPAARRSQLAPLADRAAA